jgi:hypothetical protein
MKRFILISFILSLSYAVFPQQYFIVPVTVVDGDSMPYISLREVQIKAKLTRKLRNTIVDNQKLMRNILVTMPLAIACKTRLQKMDEDMARIRTKSAQKIYYDKAEAQLKTDFEGQLKKLSYSQGKLLIKLIDRETGKTPYKHIKNYKSSYSAIFWQSCATVFGMNLNKNYVIEDETETEFLIKYLGYN